MIVIGLDAHKQSLTAVAVDEAERMLDEKTVAGVGEELLAWAGEPGPPHSAWARARRTEVTREPQEATAATIALARLDR